MHRPAALETEQGPTILALQQARGGKRAEQEMVGELGDRSVKGASGRESFKDKSQVSNDKCHRWVK